MSDESQPGSVLSVPIDVLMEKMEALMDRKLAQFASKEEIKLATEEITKLRSELDDLKQQCSSRAEREAHLQRTVELMDIRNRSRRLIFKGIPDVRHENIQRCVADFCSKYLDVADLVIYSASYIGGKVQENNIMAEFASNNMVGRILKNTRKLKGTGYVIHQDLPMQVRARRRILSAVKYKFKVEKKEVKTSMRGDTLLIDGEAYTWNDLDNQLCCKNLDGCKIIQEKYNLCVISCINEVLKKNNSGHPNC